MRYLDESGSTANSRPKTFANLVELLRARAEQQPTQTAYIFLQNGENESAKTTFAALDRRARAIAAQLQTMGMAGERALLLYPPGLAYIEAFFGCLYAGTVAVPAYPPTRRQRARLQGIIDDANPAIILTTEPLAATFQDGLGIRRCLATDRLSQAKTGQWAPPSLSSASLAFLQYTSGSTGDPKGVMVSHANLLANQEIIKQRFGHNEQSTVVGWLPLYHDMGLIGNMLQPLYLGSTAVLMPPMAFLEKPLRWLKAISVYRATTSGGPNFAYELCASKITAEQKRGLDLSSWSLAFNGSEPVRAATLERFSAAFAECGFRRESFFPCYGLAEATLFVSGEKLEGASCGRVSCGSAGNDHTLMIVDATTQQPCAAGQEGEIWVSGASVAQGYWQRQEESEQTFRARLEENECSSPIHSASSRIKNPHPAGEGRVRAKVSDLSSDLSFLTNTFSPHPNRLRPPRFALPVGEGLNSALASSLKSTASYLRTGDLGIFEQNRLYVTGRIKDLIIIRGRNHYPHDIEHALADGIPALRPDGCVAFAVPGQEQENLVIVAELSREALRQKDYSELFAAVRQILAEDCELAVADVVLVQPGGVPKTSSGKLRRNACKQAYLDNALPVLARLGDTGTATELSPSPAGRGFLKSTTLRTVPSPQTSKDCAMKAYMAPNSAEMPELQLLREAFAVVPPSQRSPLIARFLVSTTARLLNLDAHSLPTDPCLLSLGLDSLKAVELKHSLDRLLDMETPLPLFLSGRSVSELAEVLAGEAGEKPFASSPSPPTSSLSSTQLSMWTMQQMEPDSLVYNLHLALRIDGTVDADLLRQAFIGMAQRHDMLRTVYCNEDDNVVQKALPLAELQDFFSAVDAASWSESLLQDDMSNRIRQPFDLACGSVFRATLYRHREEPSDFNPPDPFPIHTLLLCAHHIAVDLWSVLILVAELRTAYAELAAGRAPLLDGPASNYADFVAWQRRYLESPAGDKAWHYWHQQLVGELPILVLPTDYPRPNQPGYSGASLVIALDQDETSRLKALAGQHGVTLFALLLAAYKVLLYRYTRQTDLIVAVPGSGRSQARFASIVGNVVNPLPLRSFPSSDQPFSAYLAEVYQTLLGALEHQDYPFSLMLERLQVERTADRWPIYQTLFVLQQAQAGADADLAQLALGEDGVSLPWADGTMRPLGIHQRIERFDLKLMAAECNGRLSLSFQYRCDLFTEATIARIAAHFRNLLLGLMTNPATRIGSLPLITGHERTKWLSACAGPDTAYIEDLCIHQLFEAQAAKTPDVAALACNEKRLAYGELNAIANRWAHHLISLGVGPNSRVAICVERSANFVIALLAVLKTGAAYVPIDAAFPVERVHHVLADAGVEAWLTQSDLHKSSGLPSVTRLDMDVWSGKAASATVNPQTSITPDHLAYVIYTSGSTGQSKGVAVSHGSLVNYTRHIVAQTSASVGLQYAMVSTPAADLGNTVLFASLISGGCLHMLDHTATTDGRVLADYLNRHPIDVLKIVPSHLAVLLDSAEDRNIVPRRTLVCGGDILPDSLVGRVARLRPECRIINHYGPTETTVGSLIFPVDAESIGARTTVPIGRPIANTQAYILDSSLEPVPTGVAGELYIGGKGLAQGYLHRPALTAERFIPDPFGTRPGERLYRTGDLARYNNDGLVEFLGRADHQLKIRGFRIEPGEIEARLRAHPDVQDAVVTAWEDEPGNKRLVAYLVSANAASDTEALRRHSQAALPDYMVPSAYVFLDALPLTPNGKLNRKALPKPDFGSQLRHQYVEPRNEAETKLAAIWAEALRMERVGIHDNFFALGGDSILSIQVASRARRAGLNLSPRQLFQQQTVAELTAVVEKIAENLAEHRDGAVPLEQDATEFPLASLTAEEIQRIRLATPDIEDIYPVTPMQEGLLFHTLVQPHSGVYLMQHRYWIEGTLDVDVFREAWQSIVDRHAILRTAFFWDAQTRPHQIVRRRVVLPFEYYDWRDLSEFEQEAQLEGLLAAEREGGFNLGFAPLLRIRLFRLTEERYLLLRSHHHILLDAWCTSLILTELREHYLALIQHQPSANEAGPAFRDYIAWLRRQDLAAAAHFWREYLQGFDEPTPLVMDRPVADAQKTLSEVADIRTFLSRADTDALHALARRSHLTLNTIVQAAWALLLSRYSGRGDVLFGITVAGRPAELPGIETMLGLFINSLPLRVRVRPEQRLAEFLRDIQRQTLEIRQYEYAALTQIQGWSELPRGIELFQHLLAFENAPVDPLLHGGNGPWRFVDARHRTHTNYPINAVVIPGAQLYLQISYQRERFESAHVERMFEHWQRLLLDMVRHPEQRIGALAMLAEPERDQLVWDWNRTAHVYPGPADFVARFAAQVERTPDVLAITCQDESLSYRVLNDRANRLAQSLIAQGIGPDAIVALLNDRGIGFATMMLGVFKAGGAYLPLDPAQPDRRLLQVLHNSGVGWLLVGPAHLQRAQALVGEVWQEDSHGLSPPAVLSLEALISAAPHTDNPPHRHAPDNLAFIIFTSGSTGAPKGAMVEHRGMFNNLISKIPTLALTAADVIAQTAGQCFDISVWQHLTALACGARVEIFPDEVVKEPSRLLLGLAERGVTILEAVPSMIQALLEMLEDKIELPQLRWLLACGEAFPPELCRRWMERFPHVQVLNAYGPAECSDDVSYYAVPAKPGETDTLVPIGYPVHNTQLYLLDRWLEPVPIGVPGEICVAGIQVGRGYLHRPDLTAEKFLPDPFGESGGRLYRSGDFGRYREDGGIEFLGRIDHQVKIRGFRIEPGEIEAQLLQYPQVEQAIVTVREDGQKGKRLVVYLVCNEANTEQAADLTDALRAHLSARLPDYMIPAAFVRLDAMPLGATGKIDRKALPEPDMLAQRQDRYIAPRNPTEALLAGIWQEVLDIERVGIEDNFFDLGGHSLLAVQVLSRVRTAFGVEMPLRSIFEASTIKQLAVVIEAYLIEQLEMLSEEEAQALLEGEG